MNTEGEKGLRTKAIIPLKNDDDNEYYIEFEFDLFVDDNVDGL